jgi:hypothetical protein
VPGAMKVLGAGIGRCCDNDNDRLVKVGKRDRKFGCDKEKL